MFIRFSASNYASIRDRQELSMVAASLKDIEGGLLESSALRERILPISLIYGANASGKTNMLSALIFMTSSVLFSHSRGEPGGSIPVKPFRLEIETEPKSKFDIDFIHDDTRYHFGFCATADGFTEEWLHAFPQGRRQMLYERSSPKDIRFGRSLKGQNKVISELMRPNSLFISAAIQNGHKEITAISGFFTDLLAANQIEVNGAAIYQNFEKGDVDQRTIGFLKKLNTGITGSQKIIHKHSDATIEIMRGIDAVFSKSYPDIRGKIKMEDEEIRIELAHRGVDGREVYFKPDLESAGTRRLLVLASLAFTALDTGSLLVIDELDASIHTQACEALLALFSDRKCNRSGAQIVVTTHDTNLMSSDLLRRDEIWFTEKDEIGATHLFPLAEIATRSTDNIEKGYLQGRFGGIPYAGSAAALFSNCE